MAASYTGQHLGPALKAASRSLPGPKSVKTAKSSRRKPRARSRSAA